MSSPENMQKTAGYKLYDWPGIPGRGEFVRLALEAGGVPYTGNDDIAALSTITNPAEVGHPPHFAPPTLELPSGRFISQTGNILNYLAPMLGLAGPLGNKLADDDNPLVGEERKDAEEERSVVNQLVLTALDLNSEAYDVHHPIDVSKAYDEQKDAALVRAAGFRAHRIPKFLKHFQGVLTSNPAAMDKATNTFLVGAQTTTADLVVFHVVTGLMFAFPRRMGALRKSRSYENVFALRDRVAEQKNLKQYLQSDRRLPSGEGVYRHYEELDAEE